MAEHDSFVIEKINSVVPFDARLYILGDVIFDKNPEFVNQIAALDRHLIWGNHDHGNLADVFQSAQDTLLLTTSPKIFLSHYAHAYWPESHKGSYHFYGHTHAVREETLDHIWPDRRSIDVGLDNAFRLLGEYRPFSYYELMEILKNRKGHDDLEFYTRMDKK